MVRQLIEVRAGAAPWRRRRTAEAGKEADPVKGVRSIMGVESEDLLERIRKELISIRAQGNKITERDLLRLSAITGIDYSTILRIEQELS
jgi:hypothetical protein